MALTSIPALEIPQPWRSFSALTFTSVLLDAAGEKYGAVLQAPKTGSIRKIHFRTGTVTTPQDLDVRIETIDASGDPSGTLFDTNTNATVAAASLTSNTWITSPALTADAAVTAGQLIAVSIVAPASTNLNLVALTFDSSNIGLPYIDVYLGGFWTKGGAAYPVLALEYSDGTFEYTPWVIPASAVNTHSFASNNVTNDEIGLKFQFPAPVTVRGAWVFGDLDGDADIVLYDSDGTSVLTSVSLDKDNRGSTAYRVHYVRFPAAQSLLASTNYRLVVKPTTTTAVAINSYDVNAAALLGTQAGGTAFHYTSRVDAGAWSDTTTRRPLLGLLVSEIDDGTGSGSGSGNLHHGLMPPHFHPHGGRR